MARASGAEWGLIISIDGIQPDIGNETIYVVRDVLTARVLAAENVTSSEPAVIKSLLAPVRHKRDHYLQALELRWVQTTSGTSLLP